VNGVSPTSNPKWPLCKGGCGKRLVTKTELLRGGRRMLVRDGMCAICLEQRMTPRHRGSLLEAPPLNTGEIRVVGMIARRVPEPDRPLVASILGLPTP
jgi:hypothetical protein